MITILRRAAFILVTILMASSAASAQATLYDNFETTTLNPSKWQGVGAGFPGQPIAQSYWLDTTRQIINGGVNTRYLELSGLGYAPTTDNINVIDDLWGVQFPTPNAVTAVSYTFVLKKAQAQNPCKVSSQQEWTGLEFNGVFFNINASPTDPSGDVQAILIAIRQSPQNSNDPVAVAATIMTGGQAWYSQAVGSVLVSQKNTASVVWNQPQHQFEFTVNGAKTIVPYVLPDTTPPFFPFKGFLVQSRVPYCTAKSRPNTNVNATLDDVYVNP